MVVIPVAALLATPLAFTIATTTFDELHTTWFVRLKVLPSLKLPVAMKRCELPNEIFGLLGETVIEVSVASDTLRDAVPTAPANTAVMVAVPGNMPAARPFLLDKSLIVATEAGEDVHVTEVVRFWTLLS